MKQITYSDIKKNEQINTYIKKADESLIALGFTEHSFAHVTCVAERAAYILSSLGFSEREVELSKLAAHLHDIGNLVNRIEHSQSGAVMAFRILNELEMPADEIATVVTAIGNHDEGTGVAVNPIAAALILADKTDVRRSRVRNTDISTFDVHDRVNYSVERADICVDAKEKTISLDITLDTKYSAVMTYFEIFLSRMVMCQKAAECLKLRFMLFINGQQIL